MTRTKQTVILHGSPTDPDMLDSAARIRRTGRIAIIQEKKCTNGQCACTAKCANYQGPQA